MPYFFNKPDPNKNFVLNYVAHIKWKGSKIARISDDSMSISAEVLASINFLDPLRDGHDYMDEFIGVTIVPALCSIAAVALLLWSVWSGLYALATLLSLAEGNGRHDNTMSIVLLGCAAAIYAVVSTIESAIGLLTRPLITIVGGYKPQNTPRFCSDDKPYDDKVEVFSA